MSNFKAFWAFSTKRKSAGVAGKWIKEAPLKYDDIIGEVTIFPKSRLGMWSVILIVLMPALLFLGRTIFLNFYTNVPAGRTIPQDIIKRPGIALPMLLGILTGIMAFVAGVVATTKKKERSILVYTSSLLGLLVLLFVLGEFLFPH